MARNRDSEDGSVSDRCAGEVEGELGQDRGGKDRVLVPAGIGFPCEFEDDGGADGVPGAAEEDGDAFGVCLPGEVGAEVAEQESGDHAEGNERDGKHEEHRYEHELGRDGRAGAVLEFQS